MSLLENFRTFLLGQSAITDIVGQRVSRDYVSERDPLPFVVYGRRTLEQAGEFLDCQQAGPWRSGIDVEGRATSQAQADDLRDALIVTLEDYRGLWDTSAIQDCRIGDVEDDYIFLTEPQEFEVIRAISLSVLSPDY